MRFLFQAVFLSLSMTALDVCYAQVADAVVVRNAINEACLNTQGTQETVEKIEEVKIPDGDRTIPARLYRPKEPGVLPVLVFLHGGGFVAGNLDTHDNACRYLCQRVSCLVLAVDYRLAPEQKFPTQPVECYTATVWAAKNATRLGGDPDHMAVIGDSSGGGLAAAVCLLARDRNGPPLCAQVLVNPTLDLSGWDNDEFNSYRLFREFYLKDSKDRVDPLASPLLAQNFEELPSAFVIVGEKDPLRAEGEAYVTTLRAAGVRANSYCQYGQGHLGPQWAAASTTAEEALNLTVAFLLAALRPAK